MKALVHAEVLKLRSTRTPAWLLLATLGLVVLTVVVNVPKVGAKNAPVSLDDPGLLAGTVGIGFGVPEVMVVLLGVLAFTQEFRYGTATSTYLGEPRRTPSSSRSGCRWPEGRRPGNRSLPARNDPTRPSCHGRREQLRGARVLSSC